MLGCRVLLRRAAGVSPRRFLVSSRLRLAEHVMKMPALGDSISEGTIASWAKQVGERVEVDDVVAVVETDKVTVDIKADAAGVIVTHLAGEEETLAVGAELLKLDTEGAAAPAPAPEAGEAAPEAAAAEPEASEKQDAPVAAAKSGSGDMPKHAHKPLIKFLGKRSLLPQAAPPAPVAAAAGAAGAAELGRTGPAWPEVEHDPHARDFDEVPHGAFFGRLPIKMEELDAVGLGVMED